MERRERIGQNSLEKLDGQMSEILIFECPYTPSKYLNNTRRAKGLQ